MAILVTFEYEANLTVYRVIDMVLRGERALRMNTGFPYKSANM